MKPHLHTLVPLVFGVMVSVAADAGVLEEGREYLIESFEHESENQLNPGTFPRLSLSPGQRFAAKGAGILSSANAYDQTSGQVSLTSVKEAQCSGNRR